MTDEPTTTAASSSPSTYRAAGPFFKIPGFAGIRAFGWQLDVTDHRVIGPLFSERYRLRKRDWLHVGPFCVRLGRVVKL